MFDDERISCIMYNHKYSKMFSGTDNGSVVIFATEAEKFDDEEEEHDQEPVEKEEEEED